MTTTTQQAIEERQVATMIHLFTLAFRGGQLAILEVRGARNQEAARTIASTALKDCLYTVADGDQTRGRAAYFYFWCSREAQECQPLYHPSQGSQEVSLA